MLVGLFKALADPTRLRLIAILQRGEFTVQELVEILAMGQSRVSRHLKILLEADLLQVKREGTWAYYRLAPGTALARQLLPLLGEQLCSLADADRDRSAVANALAVRRQRSQTFFDRHARDWDRMARELLPTPEYLPQLLESLPECATVLELGIGTGGLLEGLRQRAARVIGVDHAPAMISAARQRVAGAGLDNIDLRLGEMEHLPLETASVDAAVLNMVLHHAPDPGGVLKELARVLRPGGLLLLCDLRRHQAEWVREELADQWLGFTEAELGAWCAEAGLQIETQLLLEGSAAQYPVLLLSARLTG